MRYSLLLRGINVGGHNKVSMVELRQRLSELGLEKVASYINSGNLFFDFSGEMAELTRLIEECLFAYYPFVERFTLLSQEDYVKEIAALPDWWAEDLARKDVLFYTDFDQKEEVERVVSQMTLGEEIVHFGATALFWGKYDEKSYLKTAYHKELIKHSFYKTLTIRSHKTFAKIGEFLT